MDNKNPIVTTFFPLFTTLAFLIFSVWTLSKSIEAGVQWKIIATSISSTIFFLFFLFVAYARFKALKSKEK